MAARIPPVLITAPPPLPRPEVSAPVLEWKNPNVHYWSREMSGIVSSEYPSLPAETAALDDARFDEASAQIRVKFPELSAVLDKMARRRACVDHDLGGVKPTGLLAKVWFDYVRPAESYDLFRDTMIDMGGTCVQGDTHRLFSALVALHRAKGDASSV